MSYSKTDSIRLQPDVDLSGKLKKQIRVLVFSTAIAVAIAFGASFYYGLISNSSAVSMQFPELLPIVSKMKNILFLNTFLFSLIIIASFYLLSILVTKRLFQPLDTIHKKMLILSKGKMPALDKPEGDELFASMQRAFSHLTEKLRERDIAEQGKLQKALESISSGKTTDESIMIIKSLIEEKKQYVGSDQVCGDTIDSGKDQDDEAVFMQPV